MGEHTETFTLDGYWGDVREICIRHLKGFGYKLTKEDGKFLVFEKGNLKKNFFTFSFDTAYKQIFISTVGEEDTPVTTVSVSFSLPFLQLRRGDLSTIKSFIRALRDYIVVTIGYGAAASRIKHST